MGDCFTKGQNFVIRGAVVRTMQTRLCVVMCLQKDKPAERTATLDFSKYTLCLLFSHRLDCRMVDSTTPNIPKVVFVGVELLLLRGPQLEIVRVASALLIV